MINELAELVNVHETSDREVVYPSVVDHTTGGAADAVACMVEAGTRGVPRLRTYVPVQRLHAMVSTAHDVQTMR